MITDNKNTICARVDCGHSLSQHEWDDRFSHLGGACGFGMSAENPDGDCGAECMGFLYADESDELPAVLEAENAG